MQSAYQNARVIAIGLNPQATEAFRYCRPLKIKIPLLNSSNCTKRSRWPKSIKHSEPQVAFMNGSIDEFLAMKQQQIKRSEITPSVNFSFLLDGSGSDQHLAKQCECENAYCFLSPKALQRSHCPEDPDPKAILTSVFDDNFFSENTSKTPPQSQPFASASVATSPMQKKMFHKKIDQYNLISVENEHAPAQPLLLDHYEADELPHDARGPLHHSLHPTCANCAMPDTKYVCSTAGKKKKLKKYAMFEALQEETLTEKDILSRFGRSQNVSHILRELLREGLIHRVGQGGLKDPYKYNAQQQPEHHSLSHDLLLSCFHN
jgi:hypothetical protein